MEHRNKDGSFQVGHPGYKPKGSVSEFQKITRAKMGEFLISKLDSLDEIYQELSPRDKKNMVLALAEFYLPKQREITATIEQPATQVDLSNWSDQDLTTLDNLQTKYGIEN